MRFHPRRPSAALIVSIVALVVALGGTAFAGPVAQIAKRISGSSIKAHSISGNRLKNNTVTGAQVKETSLGTVPSAFAAAVASTAGKANSATSATHASTADLAANAQALGGVPASAFAAAAVTQRFSAAMAKGDADKTLVTLGPVTVTASCSGTSTATGKITAKTSTADALVNGAAIGTSDTATIAQATGTTPAADLEDLGVIAPDGSAGWNGQVQVAVNNGGKDCRFFGNVIDDATTG